MFNCRITLHFTLIHTACDYKQVCPGKTTKNSGKIFNCSTTIFDAIRTLNVGGTTTNATGCKIAGISPFGIPSAVSVASKADVVILALGIDRSIEHEGCAVPITFDVNYFLVLTNTFKLSRLDRTAITLPGHQEDLARAIYALKKPTILILTNGGPLAIDDIQDGAGAIVEAFNPGFGTPMLARALFGLENRWGKLPYTVYGKVSVSSTTESPSQRISRLLSLKVSYTGLRQRS